MKLYKLTKDIIIEDKSTFYLLENEEWDSFVNDDALLEKMKTKISSLDPIDNAQVLLSKELDAPLQSQEIWGSGVTYYSSKIGRQEEAEDAGGGQFYANVYEADRPELFFKATRHRTVGSGGIVKIREDSTWDAPEPELTLAITSKGKIVGYTIGNDMSSRSIEGENPLYLPQAKTYDGSASVGPCIYVTNDKLPLDTKIEMQIRRNGNTAFEGDITIDQIKRKFEDLVAYLFKACSFPHGCLLMTGTGIVPSKDFTLQKNDEIYITVEPIGTLKNTVN